MERNLLMKSKILNKLTNFNKIYFVRISKNFLELGEEGFRSRMVQLNDFFSDFSCIQPEDANFESIKIFY